MLTKDQLKKFIVKLDNDVKNMTEYRLTMQKHIEQLEEENKKLREKIKYIRKLNTYDYNELQDLNIKLNIKVASLEGEIKGLNYVIDKLREELSAYDREYFDEDKKAKNIYEKQYQHSLGGDDELIYEEWLYD